MISCEKVNEELVKIVCERYIKVQTLKIEVSGSYTSEIQEEIENGNRIGIS